MSVKVAQPGDAEIRNALLMHLGEEHRDECDVAFIEELGLCRGQVFVDVAVVNGALHGYEIKSDRDSLRRLRGQVAFYGRVLDHATVVVGQRHLDEIDSYIPDWWGIIRAVPAHEGISFSQVRRSLQNPGLDARSLVELLWLEDALALLAANDTVRGYRRRPRREVWNRICEVYAVEDVAEAVRAHLKGKAGRRSGPPSA